MSDVQQSKLHLLFNEEEMHIPRVSGDRQRFIERNEDITCSIFLIRNAEIYLNLTSKFHSLFNEKKKKKRKMYIPRISENS